MTDGQRGLILDWGGVLTVGVREVIAEWGPKVGVDPDHYFIVLRDWLGRTEPGDTSPIHALERGELDAPGFEVLLGAEVTRYSGSTYDPTGWLPLMLESFRVVADMHDVVRRARASGVRTALLSNSWGNTYPRENWDELFDVVVISGEVGLRKPDPEIYRLTTARMGVPAERCVFVDDFPGNVEAARALGMVAIHHTDPDDTVARLEAEFGVRLRP